MCFLVLSAARSKSASIRLRHHLRGKMLEQVQRTVEVMAIATDQEMLQPVLAIKPDVVDDRLCAAGECKSPTIAPFLLLSDAAGYGEERACDFASIAASALGSVMNISERIGVECGCVEGKARIDGQRVPSITEASRTLPCGLCFSADPDGRVRLLGCLRSEQQPIEGRVRAALNRSVAGP